MDTMLERILSLIGDRHGAGSKLAEYLCISPNRISDWKSGRIKSYQKYAPQIAEYYGVSLDWLCGKTDIKKDTANEIVDDAKEYMKFKEIIDSLSPDGVRDVLWYARSLVERERNE